MKKICFFFLAIALFIHNISSLQAQTTEGKEFWLTFGNNGNLNYTALNLQIRIVSGKNPVTGTITFTNLGTSSPFSMGAQEVYLYTLQAETIP